MAVSPGRAREKYLYGWVEKPSYFTGAASNFDFFGISSWWNPRRFRNDADSAFLANDCLRVAADFRSSYYKSLREHGIEPSERERRHEQISFFDPDDFLIDR